MRVLAVLIASAAAACSLTELGEGGALSGGDAGKDTSASAPDARTPEAAVDGGSDGAPDAALHDAISEPPKPPPIDAKSDVGPDTSLANAGDALSFDGSNYVSAGTLALPTDFTLEAWINPASVSGETYILAEDRADSGNQQFRFGLTDGGRLFFIMADSGGGTHGLYMNKSDGGSNYALISTGSIPTGTWTHVAVTKDGVDFALLVGGSESATFAADSPFTSGPSVDFRVAGRVASDGHSLDGGFVGVIDEVRVWNAPQANTSIFANMSQEIPISYSGFSQLYLYYRFDEGTGLTAGDTTTHYPGTLVGSPSPTWVVSGAF